MHEPLTRLERRILDYIVDYLRRNTYQPSVREIGDRFGIRSTKTVTEYLQSIADKGWIERHRSRSRGVRILSVDLRPNVVTVPCYSLPAGVPDAGGAHTSATEHYDIDRGLAGGNGSIFLRMADDSMAGAGIRNGDLVLVEAVSDASVQSGDIVAARVAGQMLIRRFERRGKTIALEPASADHPTIIVSPGRDVAIVGRATGVFRQLRRAGAAPATRKRGPGGSAHSAGASA